MPSFPSFTVLTKLQGKIDSGVSAATWSGGGTSKVKLHSHKI